jgi:iron complex outermembrane receptor protein
MPSTSISHNFTNDVLGYLTVSEGYRVGGVNSVPECTPEDIANPGQALCALPDEILIKADETTNYEIGVHSTLLDGRLVMNAAVYHIDWDKVQIDDVTLNGNLPITSNGGKAQSDGLEFSTRWRIGDSWEVSGTYAYTKAELASPTDALLGSRETGALFTPSGSRLPGSPEDQASLGLTYSRELSGGRFLDINYGVSYVGDILNSIGAEQIPGVLPYHGEKIPAYTLHHLTAKLSADQWSASLYVDNLFDEYYYTSTRSTQRLIEQYRHYLDVPTNTEGFLLRTYGRYIGRPRTIGLSFTYDF